MVNMIFMNKTIIFSDGSSRGNPGKGGFGAIIFEGDFIKEIGGREDKTTNNRMEIKGAVEALKICKGNDVVLYTDSSYLVNAMTAWIFSWQRNDWKKKVGENGDREDVLNKDLFLELLEVSLNKKIEWKKIPGHSGIPANERCDEIATNFADEKEIKLFNGKKEDYRISLDLDGDLLQNKNRAKTKGYSYVSLIKGKIYIDKTWDECKERVNGVKGAKYKKSVSEDDEKKIVEDFSELQ